MCIVKLPSPDILSKSRMKASITMYLVRIRLGIREEKLLNKNKDKVTSITRTRNRTRTRIGTKKRTKKMNMRKNETGTRTRNMSK